MRRTLTLSHQVEAPRRVVVSSTSSGYSSCYCRYSTGIILLLLLLFSIQGRRAGEQAGVNNKKQKERILVVGR